MFRVLRFLFLAKRDDGETKRIDRSRKTFEKIQRRENVDLKRERVVERLSTARWEKLSDEFANFDNRAKKRRQFVERNHVRPVARGLVRIEMRFEKERVDSDRRGRASEGADELAFASGDAAGRARFLNAVRRVENDRSAGLPHNRKGAEVVDERAVSEKRAAFAEENVGAAERFEFRDNVAHVLRRHKLTFFDVNRFAGFRGGGEKVGLAREKRRNLQQVDDFRDRRRLRRFVDVGRCRKTGLFADFGEEFETFVETETAEGADAGAVRFVERAFENELERNAIGREIVDDFAEARRDLRRRFAFEDAGAGDQKERFGATATMRADFDRIVERHFVAFAGRASVEVDAVNGGGGETRRLVGRRFGSFRRNGDRRVVRKRAQR